MGIAPGKRNLLTDVAGLRVGNADSARLRSGTTVVVADRGASAGCDVRGGAPGTRETDCLRPGNLVGRLHAVVLSGGSVFGLGAADAVTAGLSAAGTGLRLDRGTPAIPIVGAAVIYDLANGGEKDWGAAPPYARLGLAALEAASEEFPLGAVGAGRGATAGNCAGGLGSASLVFDGITVAALAVANPVGSPFMADGRTFWAWPLELGGEFGGRRPNADAIAAAMDPMPPETKLAGRSAPSLNTIIGIVATDAELSSAECERLARAAQDGIARAVRPSHTLMDGDTIFALSTRREKLQAPRERQLATLGAAAADCVARAVARGVFEANRVQTAARGADA